MDKFKKFVERMSKNYKDIDEFIKAVFTAWQIIGSVILFSSLFIGLYEHYGYRMVSDTQAQIKNE